ncbi:hypothetical protein GTQ43_20900 [Nostoc sp. KVJ3]|uniref:hypothetical protein n=1 Tax=Nostoc sp. KVJ3 TaxID=457945 RepID=UPI0022377A42|nr:hypothetical protein [Nostoc sp. KVJ3]MCW5315616.1 hypothetical protein [Nostoc sp. KVJ3]MCW5316184.1 hypothetical protein [Nostoc sp. KVJ3]
MPLTKANMQPDPRELLEARKDFLIREISFGLGDKNLLSLVNCFEGIHEKSIDKNREAYFDFLLKVIGS